MAGTYTILSEVVNSVGGADLFLEVCDGGCKVRYVRDNSNSGGRLGSCESESEGDS